ncbi:unnamed protein product [Cunninghamella blakesleeana]
MSFQNLLFFDKLDLDKNFHLIRKKINAVLKPGDLSKGSNVLFGKKNCDDDAWKRKNDKFEDLTCYAADGEVGIVSRISPNEIVNVSEGGSWQPAAIISE